MSRHCPATEPFVALRLKVVVPCTRHDSTVSLGLPSSVDGLEYVGVAVASTASRAIAPRVAARYKSRIPIPTVFVCPFTSPVFYRVELKAS